MTIHHCISTPCPLCYPGLFIIPGQFSFTPYSEPPQHTWGDIHIGGKPDVDVEDNPSICLDATD